MKWKKVPCKSRACDPCKIIHPSVNMQKVNHETKSSCIANMLFTPLKGIENYLY